MADVLGQILGDLADEGIDGDVLGAVKKAIVKASHGGANVHVNKPSWRDGQLAPGVEAPGEGYVPVGLVPQAGGGTFLAALQAIDFVGRNQKPYQARRLLVATVRTGATAVGRLLAKMFVGTDLMMGTLQAIDIELLGAATAFDTVMHFMQAPPGVEITVSVAIAGTALANADTIFASLQFLGHIIH